MNEPAETPASAPKSTFEKGLAALASITAERQAKESASSPQATPEGAPADETPATPAGDSPAAPAAPAEAPPKPEAPKPEAKPDDAELRVSRALRAAQEKERAAFEASKRAKELEARLKAAEEAEAARKNLSILDVLKERGYTYEQLTQEIVDGKLKPPTPEQLATETVSGEVAQLKKQLEELKAEREAQAKAQQAEATATQLAQELKDNARDFPVLATLPWAARSIMQRAERDGKSFAEAARELETAARRDVQTVFDSEETLKLFLGDDKIKSRILDILGIKPQTATSPASDKGDHGARKVAPSAIPQSKATDAGTRVKGTKPVTTEDRVKAGLAHLSGKRAV